MRRQGGGGGGGTDILCCRLAIVVGCLGYTAYTAQLLYLTDLTLYTAAFLNGLGASLFHTGQVQSRPLIGPDPSRYCALIG